MSLETGNEIKKTILTEPIKLSLQWILPILGTPIAVWVASAVPYVREVVWPSVPKEVLLALIAFLVATNICFVLLWRRKGSTASKEPKLLIEPDEKHQASLEQGRYSSPIVKCVSTSIMPVTIRSGKVLLKTDQKNLASNDPRAVTAKFQLKPEPETVTISLRAIISIRSDDDDAIDFIFDGVWIGTTSAYTRIEPGGFAELVLGIRRNRRLYACEPQYLPAAGTFRPVLGCKARITVELVGSRSPAVEFTKTYAFDAVLEPDFSIVEVNDEREIRGPASKAPNDMWRHAPDLASQQILMMKALYGTEEFSFLEFDSRFGQLLARTKAASFDRYLELVMRLLNRAELFYKQSLANTDVDILRLAISASSEEAADAILRENGLI